MPLSVFVVFECIIYVPLMVSFFFFFFFFQAEDGIRDRSPSRGLGDVYKRQAFSLFVGSIQAYVFVTLTTVYVSEKTEIEE